MDRGQAIPLDVTVSSNIHIAPPIVSKVIRYDPDVKYNENHALTLSSPYNPNSYVRLFYNTIVIVTIITREAIRIISVIGSITLE